MARPGDVVAGRYRIVRPIGAGGFGQIFVAEQLSMGREVALKILAPQVRDDPVALERFRLEARAACHLKHPNLVVYHDHGEDPRGRMYLAMELIEGRSLTQLLAETRFLPARRALSITVQICSALDAAHRGGVIHRDLKPGNVMLLAHGGSEDCVKVIDFGILKRVCRRRGDDLPSITDTNEIVGTPEYLAPEIAAGRHFDGRADQYSLGVLLFELLVGRRPFQCAQPVQTILAHLREPAPRISEVAPERRFSATLDELVARMLEKKPTHRFPDMSALHQALTATLAEEGAAEDPGHAQTVATRIEEPSSGPERMTTVTQFAPPPPQPISPLLQPAGQAAGAPPTDSLAPTRTPLWRRAASALALLLLVAALGTVAALVSTPLREPERAAPGSLENTRLGALREERRSRDEPSATEETGGKATAPTNSRALPSAPAPELPLEAQDEPPPSEPVALSGLPQADLASPGTTAPGTTAREPAEAASPAIQSAGHLATATPRPRPARPKRPPAPPRETITSSAGQGRGTLNVNAIPYARVTVQGRMLGNTPVVGAPLATGRHLVTASHPTLGEQEEWVRIRDGKLSSLSFDFR